ncbi:MAG: PspA/IM30 family protein [Microcystis sp. M048S1]|uniref:PspA/IM30 family protein n=1 Tax=unclassified Microcystis TaxID=2643300 RepID=UPI001195A762|nr:MULTISPECIES: PspA/IM30 family protein [unclassified Microcystis]MCA2903367.1 PspA/IM30 family protein [Microcystis sp. M035S1]MCA2723164.1 PspA/IM30 family protein [Microcystis sp. M176S2]MCA2725875.1 PspA/IM30 family protein [Microcystis sp. M166S2]MCA2729301.1 PspA/IM30 family protein [Microcystis sp. M162S2]MCA2745689.1 PspA/IM30 family protein [Microcystis sp. M155S2]
MRDDLYNLRSSIIEVIALQKRAEQQYNQAQAEVLKWQERVKLALDKGDESLAQEANIKKKHHINTANIIKNQLEKLNIQVDKLKEKLPILERKINEKSIGSIDTSIDKAVFEVPEGKVRQLQDPSQIYDELDGIAIEKKLPRLDMAEIITLQKRAEQQYNQELAEILKWDRRAKLARSEVDYSLVREAFRQKENHINIANIIKSQIEQIKTQVDTLQKNLTIFENGNNSIYRSAFERMEAKFIQLEASSQADGELVDIDPLEAGSDVEDELALLKAQMSGGILPSTASNQSNLPPATTVRDSAVDAELEQLRSKLKEM